MFGGSVVLNLQTNFEADFKIPIESFQVENLWCKTTKEK